MVPAFTLNSFRLLKNSLFGDEKPGICFIIRDDKSKKGMVVDETVQKFEELLKEAGVTNVKTILPLTKLKQDYGPNNMKIKLLNTYDLFLVESEIAEHAYTILGKHFIRKRKRPAQIDTSKKELMKTSIDNALHKVSFKISGNSNFSIFEVGTYQMENSKIVENIADAIEQLKEKWPGGWRNILRLYLKPMKQSKVSIPLYYSKINPNDVEVPVVVGVKQTRLDKLNESLAKKSKKLRLDKKSKKIVKNKAELPVKVGKKNEKKQKKVKEAALEAVKEAKAGKPEKKQKKSEAETVAAPAVESPELKKKKKKKTSESEVAVKQEVKQEVVASPPKDKKKKKAKVEEPAQVEEPKASKKKLKAEPAPAPEEPKKKKNKKAK